MLNLNPKYTIHPLNFRFHNFYIKYVPNCSSYSIHKSLLIPFIISMLMHQKLSSDLEQNTAINCEHSSGWEIAYVKEWERQKQAISNKHFHIVHKMLTSIEIECIWIYKMTLKSSPIFMRLCLACSAVFAPFIQSIDSIFCS